MANPEHLEILKQGVDEWNRWRKGRFLVNLRWAYAIFLNKFVSFMELGWPSFQQSSLTPEGTPLTVYFR